MSEKAVDIARALCRGVMPSVDGYTRLIEERDGEITELLRSRALEIRHAVYGKDVYVRGLIEISNYCKNDCLYCGIRKSNKSCSRYRLTEDDIVECCKEGYGLGFRTFVMQGGEDPYYTDERMAGIIKTVKSLMPDVAITLSLGERSRESYQRLFDAGADRYLLRHETANEEHYALLHPSELKYSERMRCLSDLKAIGYQTGAGFMVGSPHQTARHLANDLKFIESFQPEMCGIGPFIPQADTPFCEYPRGELELTCFLLSVIRIISPRVLLPATTALGSIHENGRELGILSGANVVMPNLSPPSVRKKYALYDGKISDGAESAQSLGALKERIESIGYRVCVCRGDHKNFERE